MHKTEIVQLLSEAGIGTTAGPSEEADLAGVCACDPSGQKTHKPPKILPRISDPTSRVDHSITGIFRTVVDRHRGSRGVWDAPLFYRLPATKITGKQPFLLSGAPLSHYFTGNAPAREKLGLSNSQLLPRVSPSGIFWVRYRKKSKLTRITPHSIEFTSNRRVTYQYFARD